MNERGCRNQTVLDGHGLARGTGVREQPGPTKTRLRLPGKADDFFHPVSKPALQTLAATARRQKLDAKPNFSKDDGVHGNFTLVSSQPLYNSCFRSRLGRLAEHVGIHELGHSVSVDADSIGTKNPFSGQVDSHSTSPSFGRGWRRTRRYWPRSIRSTSNRCPGSIPSWVRIFAGRVISPFVEKGRRHGA